jgi:hypothetical protein
MSILINLCKFPLPEDGHIWPKHVELYDRLLITKPDALDGICYA